MGYCCVKQAREKLDSKEQKIEGLELEKDVNENAGKQKLLEETEDYLKFIENLPNITSHNKDVAVS